MDLSLSLRDQSNRVESHACLGRCTVVLSLAVCFPILVHLCFLLSSFHCRSGWTEHWCVKWSKVGMSPPQLFTPPSPSYRRPNCCVPWLFVVKQLFLFVNVLHSLHRTTKLVLKVKIQTIPLYLLNFSGFMDRGPITSAQMFIKSSKIQRDSGLNVSKCENEYFCKALSVLGPTVQLEWCSTLDLICVFFWQDYLRPHP